jgi:signal transduction histidine kinase
MVWDWLRRRPYLVDGAIVLALLAGYVGGAAHQHRYHAGIPLAVAQVLPLLVRRRYPVAVLWIVAVATIATTAEYRDFVPFAAALAIYSVATQLDRRRSLLQSAAASFVMGAFAVAADGWRGLPELIIFAAAWVFGDSLGTRRAYTRELEEKAARLEREREAEAARAVAEEQARIARELHDVIAHNVSVMVVQAAAGSDVFDSSPARAREALRSIETTGRAALAELRRLLGVVREGAVYEPQPGLDRLDGLLDRVREAGLDVRLSVEGPPRDVPVGVGLSAYRIVQEALTNTLKHADAREARVAVRYREAGLEVEVRDDGRGETNGDGDGHGLLGMKERALLLGGELEAGPAPGGGFAVTARFPL